jgi:hypothetical protein
MGEQTPSPAAEIEAVKETCAAINRNDIPAAVKAFEWQMEWIEPPHYPGAGTHLGHTDWIDGRFADVYTFRNGKVIQMRSFGNRREALELAYQAGAPVRNQMEKLSPCFS